MNEETAIAMNQRLAVIHAILSDQVDHRIGYVQSAINDYNNNMKKAEEYSKSGNNRMAQISTLENEKLQGNIEGWINESLDVFRAYFESVSAIQSGARLYHMVTDNDQ